MDSSKKFKVSTAKPHHWMVSIRRIWVSGKPTQTNTSRMAVALPRRAAAPRQYTNCRWIVSSNACKNTPTSTASITMRSAGTVKCPTQTAMSPMAMHQPPMYHA